MSQFNVTIKPAQTEIILHPNTTFVQAYDVTNNSTETILLNSSVSTWVPADNLGSVNYTNTTTPLQFTLSNADLKLGQDFTIKAGQKKQLVLKVSNPSSEENDYYLTFFITQKPINSSITGRQNFAKIGSHLLVSTTKQSSYASELEVSQLSTSPSIKDIFTPINISGEIFNNGKHFSQINGQITIRKNNLTLWQQNLFPYTVTSQNSRLIFCLNSNNESTPCKINAPLWPGLYHASIVLNGNSSKYEYSFQFFVFPYSIIIFISTLFLIILMFIKTNKQYQADHK